MAILRRHGLDELAVAFGYDPWGSDIAPAPARHRPFGERRAFGNGPVSPDERRPLLAFAHDPAFEEEAKAVLRDSWLEGLLDAGALETARYRVDRRDLWLIGGGYPPLDGAADA